MTTIKKEAAKDVATFATISEVSKSLTDTKAVLNQVVADLYVAHIALHQVHWYMRGRGFSYGIQKWMSIWKAWMRLLMK